MTVWHNVRDRCQGEVGELRDDRDVCSITLETAAREELGELRDGTYETWGIWEM